MWCRLTWHGTGNITMPFPKPRGTCTRGLLRTNQRVAHTRGWPWHPRNKHDWHPPMHPPLGPQGKQLHCHGFGTLGLLEPSPNPNRDPPHTTQPIPQPNANANPTPDPHPCIGPHTGPMEIMGPVSLQPCLCPWTEPLPIRGSLPMDIQVLILKHHEYRSKPLQYYSVWKWNIIISFPLLGWSCSRRLLRPNE